MEGLFLEKNCRVPLSNINLNQIANNPHAIVRIRAKLQIQFSRWHATTSLEFCPDISKKDIYCQLQFWSTNGIYTLVSSARSNGKWTSPKRREKIPINQGVPFTLNIIISNSGYRVEVGKETYQNDDNLCKFTENIPEQTKHINQKKKRKTR